LLELLCDGYHDLSLRIGLAPGLRLEVLGEQWVAFSAVSGETLQLNQEAAAVLDLLRDGPMTESELSAALAAETGAAVTDIEDTLREVWPTLEAAGLIRR